jgi:activator of 2-hydroxyglutaryl-CoA dehydratase
MVFAGIDAGSITTEAAVVDEAGSLAGRVIRRIGADGAAATESVRRGRWPGPPGRKNEPALPGRHRLGPGRRERGENVRISATCALFAGPGVVGLIAAGRPREGIILGIHHAAADRARALLARGGVEADLTVTGGVVRYNGLMDVPARRPGVDLRIPDERQIVAAPGAALIARARAVSGKRP